MTWFKVDDNLAFHPKVLAAGNTAMGLWVRAGAWSSDQLTDGHIPAAMLPAFGARKADAERLVTAGLWSQEDDGYQFHEWLDRNPSRAEVEEIRANRNTSATWASHARWHTKRGITDPECEHCTRKTKAN